MVSGRASLYATYAEGATLDAARALAAARWFDPERHDRTGACSEASPCRLCYYDAAAAVAAVLIHLEERQLTTSGGADRSARPGAEPRRAARP